MSLLSRYKGHRSSLTLFSPKEVRRASVQKVFSSYKNVPLPPMDSVELENQKAVNTDSIPDAGDDIPSPGDLKESNHVDLKLERPQPLPESSNPDFAKAFADHANVAMQMCDFLSPAFDLDAKAVKTDSLTAILAFITAEGNYAKLAEEQRALLFGIIEAHVFRLFVPIESKFLFSDDLVAITEPSLVHLTLVFQILRMMIEKDDAIGNEFIQRVISRFALPDPDERNELSQTVIKWSVKHEKQKEIKKQMCHILSDYMCHVNTPHFVLPSLNVLKEFIVLTEDGAIFQKYLIPLLGAPHITSFSKELFTLIEQFCDADQTYSVPAIHGLMYHWPKTRSSKLIIFLTEMTTLLTKIKAREFKDLRVPVFKLFGAASCSPNYKVAEAAFSVWTKLPLEPLIMDSARYVFPLIYAPVSQALKSHWSSSVIDTMNSTLEAMNKIDSFLFQELCRSKIQPEEKDLVRLWATVSRQAMHQDRDLNLAAKLAEIQKTFTKPSAVTPAQQQQQQQAGKPLSNSITTSAKRLVQPQIPQGRSSRGSRI